MKQSDIQKLEYLKKENEILKQLLKSINKAELYELSKGLDKKDEHLEYLIYFSLKKEITEGIESETDEEKKQIKEKILSYLK